MLLEELLDDPWLTDVGLLLEAQAALQRRVDAALRARAGMALPVFEVLVRLARSPRSRLRMSELSRQLSLTTGGITRLVDRIEADHLLRRVPDPTDRRVAHAQITDAGREALRRALLVHHDVVERDFVAPLGPTSHRALATASRSLRDHLTGDPAARLAAQAAADGARHAAGVRR